MIKISGLEGLTKTFEDARKALKDLDGELGTVKFDPNDPASIEVAIQEIEQIVDSWLGAYASNPIIGPLAESMKQQYRQGVIDSAAAARLEGEEE